MSARTMSGGRRSRRAIAWSPSLTATTCDVFVGERQLDDALNGDAVVGQEQGMRHLGSIGRSDAELQAVTPQTRARALALMKSTISCIGVPGRKIALDADRLQLRDVDVGNDAADHHQHIVEPLLLQQLHQPRRDVIVRAGQDRQADDVGVFLQRRRRRSARASGAGRCRSLPCPRRAARAQ